MVLQRFHKVFYDPNEGAPTPPGTQCLYLKPEPLISRAEWKNTSQSSPEVVSAQKRDRDRPAQHLPSPTHCLTQPNPRPEQEASSARDMQDQSTQSYQARDN